MRCARDSAALDFSTDFSMLAAVSGLLRRASVARPLTTAASTGFAVMSVGDAAVQMATESRIDSNRILVTSLYNGAVSPLWYKWYRFMDALIPGLAIRRLVPKVIVSQICTTGVNNPAFFAWCEIAEAWINRGDGAVNWGAVRESIVEKLRRELPHVYSSSLCFWMPVNAANYAFVPDHLRILWISTCSLAWSGYVSYVAHRKNEHIDAAKV